MPIKLGGHLSTIERKFSRSFLKSIHGKEQNQDRSRIKKQQGSGLMNQGVTNIVNIIASILKNQGEPIIKLFGNPSGLSRIYLMTNIKSKEGGCDGRC